MSPEQVSDLVNILIGASMVTVGVIVGSITSRRSDGSSKPIFDFKKPHTGQPKNRTPRKKKDESKRAKV
jgi:hypothetical protein|tara:strand:+ start:1423 stop:1629 length:207 start_codon:yes stop_codon:yes gene_type:complete